MSALMLASCWTPQHDEETWRGRVLARSRAHDVGVDEVGARLANRVDVRKNAVPQPGDVVVYSIDVETPSTSYRRYLRFTVEAGATDRVRAVTITQSHPGGRTRARAFRSHMLPVKIDLFDETGELLGESRTDEAAVELLAMGFAASCEAYLECGGNFDFESIDDAFEVAILDGPPIFSIGYMLESVDTLYDLAFDLVDASLALTVLWNFGISFTIEPKYKSVERIDHDETSGRPGYRFPIQFRVNDYPALRLAATVVEPYAPIGLTAGITRIDGFRPTDDRYRFRVRLVPSE